QPGLGPAVQRLRIPLRAADGSQQHRIGLQAAVQCLLGQGFPAFVDGHAAEGKFSQIYAEAEFAGTILQDGSCCADNFRADTIAGKNGDGPLPWAHTATSETFASPSSAASSADWRPAARLISSSVISFLASASAITWR